MDVVVAARDEQAVIGRLVEMDGVQRRVVGVMPEGFRPPFLPDAALWRALSISSFKD